MPKRRRIVSVSTLSVAKDPVITVDKYYLWLFDSDKSVVYFIRGSKSYRYRYGRSRILYIGRTQGRGKRPFESLGERAHQLLRIHGIKNLDVVYIEAKPG